MSYTANVVDKHGNPAKLSSYQKNEIYRRAKSLKERLSEKMCTKVECSHATPERVKKMLNSEFRAHHEMDYYTKSMQAIGADPKDADIERIRRRG